MDGLGSCNNSTSSEQGSVFLLAATTVSNKDFLLAIFFFNSRLIISFTGFLYRRAKGIISRALANREGHGKTFFKVYDKVKTVAMSQAQWCLFLEELEKISPRDCLIAKVMLQGGKQVTVITYPKTVMEKLKEYVG